MSATLRQYFDLTKPRVVALIVFTALVGMLLAVDGWPDGDETRRGLLGFIGIWLAASSAAAINQLLDARIDAKMARTSWRPIVAGQVTPAQALAFALVLVQLMVMPDILVVENYKTMASLGIVDTLLAIGLPYFASAFAIFLLRQTFLGIPKELDEAARVEGASAMQVLWRVYVPLAKPVYTAFALVSVSFHWNNFLWPLIVTNSVNSRPLTVGLQVFSSVDQGVDWSIITAATLMSAAPLLVAFLLFQRQFVQSFMRAGIK